MHLQQTFLSPQNTKCLNKRLWCSEWCKQARSSPELLTCFILRRAFVDTMPIKIKRFVVRRLKKTSLEFQFQIFYGYFFSELHTEKKQTEEILKASHTQKNESNANKISFTTKFKFSNSIFIFYTYQQGQRSEKIHNWIRLQPSVRRIKVNNKFL